MSPRRADRDPKPPRAPAAEPGPVGWGDVIAESAARSEAEHPVEPLAGDLLQHPTLGKLEVLDVGPTRLEVRDVARNRRKLARAVLEFRLLGERRGRRVLRVTVRRET